MTRFALRLLNCLAVLALAATDPSLAQGRSPSGSGQDPPGREQFIDRFKAANTTHDGHLTQAQAEAGNMKFVAQHFSEIDTSGKGYVTLQDIGGFLRAQQAKKAATSN